MNYESMQPSHGAPQRPQPAGALTAAQRNFAQVVGQALAEAWRRQGGQQQPADNRPTPSG